MSTVTLIGEALTEPDTEFVYRGESADCEGCPYRGQCLNLARGTRYRVTSVRENAQTLDCAVHEGGVRAVEVEAAPVVGNVSTRGAFAGNKTGLEGPCPHVECPSHEYCVPDGIDFEREYRIANVEGDPPHDRCLLDRDLTLVEFEPEG